MILPGEPSSYDYFIVCPNHGRLDDLWLMYFFAPLRPGPSVTHCIGQARVTLEQCAAWGITIEVNYTKMELVRRHRTQKLKRVLNEILY